MIASSVPNVIYAADQLTVGVVGGFGNGNGGMTWGGDNGGFDWSQFGGQGGGFDFGGGNNGGGQQGGMDWSGFAGGFNGGGADIGSDAGSGGNAQSGLNAKIKGDMPTTVPSGVEKSSQCKVEKKTYNCKFTGKQKTCNVILPPNYDPSKKYPVMFILHGIMGSENDMVSGMGVQELMTGLMSSGQAEEFIAVTPNMFTSKTMNSPSGINQQTCAEYDNFLYDVSESLLPFIQENYSVKTGRENTAITGFSMGGREAIYCGIMRPDLFGYVGGACPAPGITPGSDMFMTHPGCMQESEMKFRNVGPEPAVFMITGGTNDSVVGTFPKQYSDILTKNGVEHVYQSIPGGGHGAESVKPHLYTFMRYAFKAASNEGSTNNGGNSTPLTTTTTQPTFVTTTTTTAPQQSVNPWEQWGEGGNWNIGGGQQGGGQQGGGASQNSGVIKIMPVGDSITFGMGDTGGYRKFLYNSLKQKGYNIDMVGPEGTNSTTTNGLTYDDNHAGYSGFQIKQRASWGNDSSLYEKLKEKNAVKQAQPDIVLLIIGTNDMNANRSTSDCEKDLRDLMDYILSDMPSDGMLFLGTIPELSGGMFGGGDKSAQIASYNSAIKKVAEEYKNNGKHVTFADVHGCLNGTADLGDGIHPNSKGYEKIGNLFSGLIEDYVKSSKAPETTTTTTTTTTTAVTTTTTTAPSVKVTKAGDANCDGNVDMSDAVLIMQALSNPNKYGIGGSSDRALTEQGEANADVDKSSAGLTANDALKIQEYLLGIAKSL